MEIIQPFIVNNVIINVHFVPKEVRQAAKLAIADIIY